MSDIQLRVGSEPHELVTNLLEDGSISQKEFDSFFDGAQAFFIEAVRYAMEWLPVKDKLIKAARFLNFDNRTNADLKDVEYFVKQ